jgi:tetratricopeptide (TPR) repeat protein
VLNGLESLVDKNLLKQNEVNGEPRFEMLETMREYAREKLLAAGEGEQTQARHLEFFTQLALTAEPALEGPNQVAWLNRLEIEHDNLRWALRWALEREDSDSALRLGGALAHFWTVRGHWSEGWQWLQRALEMSRHAAKESPVSRALRSKVLIQVDTLVWLQGDFGIRRALIEESLALSRELGDKQGMASSLSRLGLVALDQGDHATARALFQEGLVLSRELGDKQGIAILLHNLGLVARVQGDYAAAWALHQDSLALRREVSNKQGMAGSLNSLGAVAHAQGNHTSARALYQESLALYRELGDKRGIASSLTNLGIVAHVQGDYVIARALYQGGLTLYSELGYKRGIAAGLGNLGDLALMEGNYAAARTQYAESLTLMRELGNKLSITNCLVGWANLAQATGQVARATKLCGSVEASLQAIAAHLLSPEREMVERTVAALRAQIDEATFNALWTEGRAMSMEQAVAFALSVA